MEYENSRMKKKEEKKASVKEEGDKSQTLDPLMRLLQQSNVKLDKFFVEDGVKE